MTFDIPLCWTKKKQKQKRPCHFLVQRSGTYKLKHKTATNTAFFTHNSKKEALGKLQQWAILLIFEDNWRFFLLVYSMWSYLQWDANGNENWFGSNLGHLCYLQYRGIFLLSASILANCFSVYSLTLPFFLSFTFSDQALVYLCHGIRLFPQV